MDENYGQPGHNSAIGGIAAEALRQFVERWERLQSEKEAIAADQKDVMAQAKAAGYDCKILRKVIALRKMDPVERAETEQLLELYLAALGEGR